MPRDQRLQGSPKSFIAAPFSGAARLHPRDETLEDGPNFYNFNNEKGIDFLISYLERWMVYK